MCNKLHRYHEKIPESGVAYKIVTSEIALTIEKLDEGCKKRVNTKFSSLVNYDYYLEDFDGWIIWNEWKRGEKELTNIPCEGDGFGMFLDKEEATRVMKLWNSGNTVSRTTGFVTEVEYRKGLGKYREEDFMGDHCFNVMMAKEFKFKEV